MTLMTRCDREGCGNTRECNDDAFNPWGKWVIVRDTKDRNRKYHFCSFKCGIAVAREKATAEPPDDPDAARAALIRVLDDDWTQPFMVEEALKQRQGHLEYDVYMDVGPTGRTPFHPRYRTWAQLLKAMESDFRIYVHHGWEAAE